MNKIKYFIIATFLIQSFQLFSQDHDRLAIGALVTDRPDATESASTVHAGYIQIETGALYESFEKNNIKEELYTYNTTLVRIGLLDNLELRLGGDFSEIKTSGNHNVLSGYSPLLFGTKVAISEEKGWLPELALIGHIYLPFTAGTDYKPETTGADFRFSGSYTLGERSSIGYNLGAQWAGSELDFAYIYTLAYGFSVTDAFGVYAELYGDFPEHNKANHFWDAGVTYLISDNVQLDATVGSSITKGQDLLLSGGVSFRLPLKKQ